MDVYKLTNENELLQYNTNSEYKQVSTCFIIKNYLFITMWVNVEAR